MSARSIVLLMALFAIGQCAQVRFLNNIQGQRLTTTFSTASAITLDFMQFSSWFELTSDTILSVSNGQVQFNNLQIPITADTFTTFVLRYNPDGGLFDVYKMAENDTAATVVNGQAYIRLTVLGGAQGFLSLSVGNTILYSYIGLYNQTQVSAVAPGTSNFFLFQSGGQIAATYPITLPTGGLQADTVYTIFFFTPTGSNPIVSVVNDRTAAGVVTQTGSTPAPSTPPSAGTTGAAASTTGVAAGATTGRVAAATTGRTAGVATTGKPASSTTGAPVVINPEDSSAVKASVSVIAALAVAYLAF